MSVNLILIILYTTLVSGRPPTNNSPFPLNVCTDDLSYFIQNYLLLKQPYKPQPFMLPSEDDYKDYSRFAPLSSEERTLFYITAPSITLLRSPPREYNHKVRSVYMKPLFAVSPDLFVNEKTMKFLDLLPKSHFESAVNMDIFSKITINPYQLFKESFLLLFYSYRDAEVYATATQSWYVYEVFATETSKLEKFTISSKYISNNPFSVSYKNDLIDDFDIRAVYDAYNQKALYNSGFRIIHQHNDQYTPVRRLHFASGADEDNSLFTGIEEYNDFLRDRWDTPRTWINIYDSSLNNAVEVYISESHEFFRASRKELIFSSLDSEVVVDHLNSWIMSLVGYLLYIPDFLVFLEKEVHDVATVIICSLLVVACSQLDQASYIAYRRSVIEALFELGLGRYHVQARVLIDDLYAESRGVLSYSSIAKKYRLQGHMLPELFEIRVLSMMMLKFFEIQGLDRAQLHYFFVIRIIEIRVISQGTYGLLKNLIHQYFLQNQALTTSYRANLLSCSKTISEDFLMLRASSLQKNDMLRSMRHFITIQDKRYEILLNALSN